MKNIATALRLLIVLLGIGSLALMLWFPNIEGRNVNSTLFEVYFRDPMLAFAYLASLSYYFALYQGFKALGYIGRNQAASPEVVKSVRTIKYCALILIGFVAVGEVFIMMNDSDDRAGGVALGVMITFGAVIIALAASKFEKKCLS